MCVFFCVCAVYPYNLRCVFRKKKKVNRILGNSGSISGHQGKMKYTNCWDQSFTKASRGQGSTPNPFRTCQCKI